jgi:hypothetical protein
MAPAIGAPDYYYPFVQSLLNQLNWKAHPDLTVWHYTSGPGLISIIESGSIYATQVACLNESTEIRYAASKVREALTELLPTLTDGNPETQFVKTFIEGLTDTDSIPNNNRLPYFVSCFSSLRDDLSQWRSYGGGENGYAIGIKVRDLWQLNSLVAQVVYDADVHAQLAKQVADATVGFYLGGLEANVPKWNEVFLNSWDYALTQIAPVVKDPGFELENEVRVIHQLQEVELPELRILQRKTMMSRHLPMKFRSTNTPDSSLLPIQEVIVGPSRHKEISRISVDSLLVRHGYPTDLVKVSKRPYQET